MKKWKCTVCGYVFTGDEPPEKCPACSAEKSMFIEVTEEKPAEKPGVNIEKVADKDSSESSSAQRKWKCTICNYIHTGDEPPEKCPVCGVDKSFFIEIESQEKPEKNEREKEPVADPATAPAAPEKKADQFGLAGRMIMRHHLHPISIHTPNGVLPVAIVFLLGGTFLGYGALELASFFNIIFVLVTMPAVVATGYIAWQVKYSGARTFVFTTKMFCGLIVAVALTLMICWRLIDQTIAFAGGTGTYIYLGLGILALAAAGIAGHLGGKLVFNK